MKKILIMCVVVLAIANGITFMATSNGNLDLTLMEKAFAQDDLSEKLDPIAEAEVQGADCPVGPGQLPGSNGYATDCDGEGLGCVPYDCQ